MAETYHILNYKEVPLKTLTILVKGLRADSRLMMAMTKTTVDMNTYLQAGILDRLSFLAWAKTKDGQKNQNRPESVVDALTNSEKPKKSYGASTGEEYEKLRKEMIKKVRENNGDGHR